VKEPYCACRGRAPRVSRRRPGARLAHVGGPPGRASSAYPFPVTREVGLCPLRRETQGRGLLNVAAVVAIWPLRPRRAVARWNFEVPAVTAVFGSA
jgi:hypothetical protein